MGLSVSEEGIPEEKQEQMGKTSGCLPPTASHSKGTFDQVQKIPG